MTLTIGVGMFGELGIAPQATCCAAAAAVVVVVVVVVLS